MILNYEQPAYITRFNNFSLKKSINYCHFSAIKAKTLALFIFLIGIP